MKINIQTRQGLGKESDFASICDAKTVSLKDISREIEEQVGIPMIRSMSVLDAFATIVRKHIADGNTVDMEGLVRLRPSVTVKDGKPALSRIICSPVKVFKTEMEEIDFIINNR